MVTGSNLVFLHRHNLASAEDFRAFGGRNHTEAWRQFLGGNQKIPARLGADGFLAHGIVQSERSILHPILSG